VTAHATCHSEDLISWTERGDIRRDALYGTGKVEAENRRRWVASVRRGPFHDLDVEGIHTACMDTNEHLPVRQRGSGDVGETKRRAVFVQYQRKHLIGGMCHLSGLRVGGSIDYEEEVREARG
jgi:hypothetical protein